MRKTKGFFDSMEVFILTMKYPKMKFVFSDYLKKKRSERVKTYAKEILKKII